MEHDNALDLLGSTSNVESNSLKSYDIYLNNNTISYFFRNYIDNLIFKKYNIVDKNTILNTENIIFENEETIITCNNIYNLAKIYAVQDLMNKNRFIIIISHTTHISFLINSGGIILYFNEDNKIYSKHIVNSHLLVSYDVRNSYISKQNTFFRNQYLIFLAIHRDNNKLIININEFDYDEQLINHTEFYTDINPNRYYSFNVYLNKFITLSDNSCIDISSFNINKNNITFRYYNFENIETFIQNISNLENNDDKFDDGYPLNCIKCNNKTSRVTICHNYMIMNMGSGFCSNCIIRYSKSEKRWKCSKIINNYHCCSDLDLFYECKKNHDKCEYIFDMKKSQKYPFKNEGTYTIKLI